MKDLSEAELIEVEQRADSLVFTLDHDPDEMRHIQLVEAFNTAFKQAQEVSRHIASLCEQLRAARVTR